MSRIMSFLAVLILCFSFDIRAEPSVAERLADRAFPSVFQAWSPADNVKGEEPLVTVARHDLVFNGAEFFRLKWDHKYRGLATEFTPSSIKEGLAFRQSLLKLNPNMILILEIRYRDADSTIPKGYEEAWSKSGRGEWCGFLPEDHKWWKRDKSGKLVMGWEEGGYVQLDFANPEYREHVGKVRGNSSCHRWMAIFI